MLAWVLVVLAALLVPLAITAHWLGNSLLDTKGYVATVAPLAKDRSFTDELATQVTNALYDALPAEERNAASATALRPQVQVEAARTMANPSFPAVWDAANAQAQREALAAFTGRNETGLSTSNGVTLDLTPIVTQLGAQLDRSNVTLFDGVVPSITAQHRLDITLMNAGQLSEARSLFGVLSHAQWYLAGAAAILFGTAFAVGTRRWHLVVGAGLCSLATTALGFGGLSILRSLVASRAATFNVNRSLSLAVFDMVDRNLRHDLLVAGAAAIAFSVVTLAAGLLWSRRVSTPRRAVPPRRAAPPRLVSRTRL